MFTRVLAFLTHRYFLVLSAMTEEVYRGDVFMFLFSCCWVSWLLLYYILMFSICIAFLHVLE